MKLRNLFSRNPTTGGVNLNPAASRTHFAVAHDKGNPLYHLTPISKPEALHAGDGTIRPALCGEPVTDDYCVVDTTERLVTFAYAEDDEYKFCQKCETLGYKKFKKERN